MGTEIFLISTSLFTGGAERQAIWLANSLSKFGYKVNLLVLKKGDELSHLVNKDINILRFQIYSSESRILFKYLRLARLALKTIFRIRKIINKSNAQNKVIISFMFHSYVFGYLAKFAKSNVKLVYSIRSDRLGRRTSRKSKLRHLIFKFISFKANAILFNSISGMEAFKKELNRNLNFLYIPNGIIQINKIDNDKIADTIKDFLGNTNLGYVVSARVDPLNNFSNLIEALRLLDKDKIDFRCVIFGRGVEADEIKLKIKKLKLSHKILMLGNIKNSSSYFHLFNLLIHPAFHAGFSNSVTEAIQAGLNVSIGSIGDTTKIFEDSELVFKSFSAYSIYESIINFNKLDITNRKLLIEESQNKINNLLNNEETIKKWVKVIE
tara:strand:- start:3075 stop:4217 length:1143 start_codon:yes stop_codon:yes gene_type:complete